MLYAKMMQNSLQWLQKGGQVKFISTYKYETKIKWLDGKFNH